MTATLGILVRSDPYDRRGGRERLDPVLAAASLEIPLKIFFVGDGVLHLVPRQQPGDLPASPYTRAWAALSELSEQVELVAESAALKQVSGWSGELIVEVRECDKKSIARELNECGAVIHV